MCQNRPACSPPPRPGSIKPAQCRWGDATDDAGYQAGDHRGEIARLRECLSLLSQASRRINESLDFDDVLQGTLDSARSLTAARYGVMTLRDGAGEESEHRTLRHFQ